MIEISLRFILTLLAYSNEGQKVSTEGGDGVRVNDRGRSEDGQSLGGFSRPEL
jgi:hypothetical protein